METRFLGVGVGLGLQEEILFELFGLATDADNGYMNLLSVETIVNLGAHMQ